MDEGTGFFASETPAQTLRQTALAAIDATSFYPENGRARLRDMIANRPDWCISRQRSWGVPLPIFLHKDTGEAHPRTLEFIERAAQLVEQAGIEAWAKLAPAEWLGSDAGAAHAEGPEADLYLEGHDQHRGWFHSSLLIASALYGRAPYKGLLTHGFVVDGQGRKMSKSVGNVVAPQAVSDKMGAEILRLWTAATDYSGDLGLDDKILARVVDSYRRIRNTLRFLLANVSDFDAKSEALPLDQLLEVDRYALARASQFQAEVLAHFERYEFHPVVAKLQVYCSEDLGAFYLDVLKDRLYTTAPKSLARRSAQTALWRITHAMLRWMAPFLSFTAEEAWKTFGTSESIFFETFSDLGTPDAALLAKWSRIREIRDIANKDIEAVRAEGKVGASLQANITVTAPADDHALLASLGEDLKFVFITSQVTLLALP